MGKAVGELVKTFPENLRVGFCASGGLSHFQAEEDLDEAVIEAMRNHDLDYLAGLDVKRLQAGSSEIRNWLVLAGACPHLDMDWISLHAGLSHRGADGYGPWLCDLLSARRVLPVEGLGRFQPAGTAPDRCIFPAVRPLWPRRIRAPGGDLAATGGRAALAACCRTRAARGHTPELSRLLMF